VARRETRGDTDVSEVFEKWSGPVIYRRLLLLAGGLTMMEQSTDVDRFRCEPIGRHIRTRAGRVPACGVAITTSTCTIIAPPLPPPLLLLFHMSSKQEVALENDRAVVFLYL